MAKKRKTRQEKMLADLRRKLQVTKTPRSVVTTSPTYSLLATQTTPKPALFNYQLRITNYAYVLSDLKKTAFLTTIALGAQIVLYFVMR